MRVLLWSGLSVKARKNPSLVARDPYFSYLVNRISFGRPVVGTARAIYLKIVSNAWPVIESGVKASGSCQVRFCFTNFFAAERKRARLFLSASSRDISFGLQAIAVRIPIF